ncbi:hypothetical protein Tco_0219213 [Tanacetum coccineum]
MKAQVTPVGEVGLSIPSGTKREVVMISSTSVPLLASRAVSTVGMGFPKSQSGPRMKGTALMLCWQSQLLGFREEKSRRRDSGQGAA